ncbi:hypothetical protein K0M31_007759, partial [Melipona bicolor]
VNSNSNLTNHRKIYLNNLWKRFIKHKRIPSKEEIVRTSSSFGRLCLHVLVSLVSFQVIRRPNDGNDQPSMALVPSRAQGEGESPFSRWNSLGQEVSSSRPVLVAYLAFGEVCWETELSISWPALVSFHLGIPGRVSTYRSTANGRV